MVGRRTLAVSLVTPCWLSGLEDSRSSVLEFCRWNRESEAGPEEEEEEEVEEEGAGGSGLTPTGVREGDGRCGFKPKDEGPGEGDGEGAGEGRTLGVWATTAPVDGWIMF